MTMMEFFTDPTAQKWGGVLLCAGLAVLGHYYPDLENVLDILAGAVGVGPIAYHTTAPKDRKPVDS